MPQTDYQLPLSVTVVWASVACSPYLFCKISKPVSLSPCAKPPKLCPQSSHFTAHVLVPFTHPPIIYI